LPVKTSSSNWAAQLEQAQPWISKYQEIKV